MKMTLTFQSSIGSKLFQEVDKLCYIFLIPNFLGNQRGRGSALQVSQAVTGLTLHCSFLLIE